MAELKGDAKQEYVAGLFARIARRYDLMNDLMTFGQHRRWKRHTARLTAKGLQGISLDIATGTGDLARALSRQPEIDHSVGLDLLPEMITLGHAKARGQGLSAKTTMMLGDALRLPFPDGSFACATAGFSLRNMTDLKGALAEMVRVVKPGGRITTLDLSPMADGIKSSLFRFCFHRLVPLMGYIIAGNRSAYTYLPQSVDYFLEADRLAEMFQEIGLVNVGFQRMGMGTVALHWGQRPI
ncbi:MAG: hypothetical protein BZY81_03595 [SAR202 cluster bacterium Io17-Chloro-G4]|nr:MAG: hypothetical protein BZY81_03595 [SAR202 cluster bacterium Io17-Chloro-G4]